MSKISANLIKIGFLLVCIDLGAYYDVFNDGIGYLFILVGTLMFTVKSGWQYAFIQISTIVLIPLSFFVSIWAHFGNASWGLMLARCIPPLLSLPLGILLVIHTAPYVKNGTQKQKSTCLIYVIAQILDLACVWYFVPIRTSMLINSFNTRGPWMFIFSFLYAGVLIKYILFFSPLSKQSIAKKER